MKYARKVSHHTPSISANQKTQHRTNAVTVSQSNRFLRNNEEMKTNQNLFEVKPTWLMISGGGRTRDKDRVLPLSKPRLYMYSVLLYYIRHHQSCRIEGAAHSSRRRRRTWTSFLNGESLLTNCIGSALGCAGCWCIPMRNPGSAQIIENPRERAHACVGSCACTSHGPPAHLGRLLRRLHRLLGLNPTAQASRWQSRPREIRDRRTTVAIPSRNLVPSTDPNLNHLTRFSKL